MMPMTITEGKGEYHDEYKYCKKPWIVSPTNRNARIHTQCVIHNVVETTVNFYGVWIWDLFIFYHLVRGFVVRQTHAHSSARKVPEWNRMQFISDNVSLNITKCVLLPTLWGISLAQAQSLLTWQALLISLAYSVSILGNQLRWC